MLINITSSNLFLSIIPGLRVNGVYCWLKVNFWAS